MSSQKVNRKIDYWRVTIVYKDGESSGNRVFADRTKAENWAKRQERSNVVKKCKVEPFTRSIGDWRKRSR